jgi:Glycosyl hydrolase catalytic core
LRRRHLIALISRTTLLAVGALTVVVVFVSGCGSGPPAVTSTVPARTVEPPTTTVAQPGSTVGSTTTAAPPVETKPMTGAAMLIGVNANVAGYGAAREQLVLSDGFKLIREDRGDYAVSWAHAHGINCIGVIYLNPDSPGTGCDEIELDNEPYWENVDPIDWARQALAVAKTLRARGIDKPILLPLLAEGYGAASFDGTGDYRYDGVTKPWVEWLNEGAPDIWQYVDGFSIHPYSPTSQWTPTAMNDVRAELQAIPAAANKPFWITEFGWATGGPSGGWAVTEANQAGWLATAIDQLKARSDVAAIVVYQLVDQDTSDTTTSEAHYGLLRTDGSAKPAYAVVRQAARASQAARSAAAAKAP